MQILHSFNSLPLLNSSPPFSICAVAINAIQGKAFSFPPNLPLSKTSTFSFSVTGSLPNSLFLAEDFPFCRSTHVPFCSASDVSEKFSSTQLPAKPQNGSNQESEELELLGKPSHVPVDNGSFSKVDNKEEALAPFLKFFKPRDSLEQGKKDGGESEISKEVEQDSVIETSDKVSVQYYEPKPGDLVVGVVVSGNENKLDVNVGADLLGTMLTKEVLPLYDKEMDYLLCDAGKYAEDFMLRGKMGILKNDDALSGEAASGRPVVDAGTVLFAEVLGRTLSGRPLLSPRRLFRKVAWHRVRQIKQLGEPIEVRITEWNTGGLLTRIEGLRAFLPKTELMNRVRNFAELKEYVGHRMHVKITRIDEPNNDVILSEKEAWEILHLQEGTLLEGTVRKILPFGAEIRIGESNRSGLLHLRNITRGKITSVGGLLTVGEKIKVLVVSSTVPGKISLSTAELESEPGLFLSNKERVFSDAERMAKKYKQTLPALAATRVLEPLSTELPSFDSEANLYSNWRWFKFERHSSSD
ncbi:protein PIGMENT DEFECTIVE 338, chloroplastic isoform X2 [Malania oleifera]|uniref:protein PIGMENT DEFECTIVE 338, chloroplastic isoform X2 n=1 Tax=Malania oleifera TaxID=397392 RepID=UPI0025ADA0E3|nr:protein PIGMENT DEFECTIVE 338, chloroplastic isoform X2 [Malania oleifera]